MTEWQCVQDGSLFFFTVFVVILFTDIIWNGRSVHCRAVRRSQQYDSSVDRKSDHAYVNGNDSGTCHGSDSDDRSVVSVQKINGRQRNVSEIR